MPKRTTPTDLDQYLPDEASVAEFVAGPTAGNRVDPALVEKLRRMGTNPNIMRVAPPSVTEYVAPTALPGAGSGERTARRAEAKVEVAVPLKATEFPTMPSLKRVQGEPEVPGVVKGQPREASKRTRGRTAVLIFAVVLLPLILVILFRGRTMPQPAAAPTTTSPKVAPTLSPVPTAPSALVRTVPSAEPSSLAPIAPASAAAAPAPAPTLKPSGRVLKDRTAAPTAGGPATAAPIAPTAVPLAPAAVTREPPHPPLGPPSPPQPPSIPKVID